MIRTALLLAALAIAAAPAAAAAEECTQLTGNFDICLAGTHWENAEIEQFGDGATFHDGESTLDYIEPYASRGTGTLAQDMAALNSFFEVPPEAILRTGALEDPDRQAVIQVFNDPDSTRRLAQSIVEIDGQRILLTTGAAWDAWLDDMAREITDLSRLLRLRCPGGC